MAESVAAIGLAANIVQLIVWATKIVKRIDEFQSQSHKIPKLFRDIKTQLPLLLDTLGETQKQAEQGALEAKTQKALEPVIEGCKTECGRLEKVLDKILPAASDDKWKRGRKAYSSLAYESKVKDIIETVRVYIENLTYYQAARAGRLNLGEYLHTTRSRSPQPESRKVFLVPFERDDDYVDRAGIIGELDERRKLHRRVSLAGIGGVGWVPMVPNLYDIAESSSSSKSQLAIEYCYRFREQNPGANVLWVHAASLAQLDQGYREIARKLSLVSKLLRSDHSIAF